MTVWRASSARSSFGTGAPHAGQSRPSEDAAGPFVFFGGGDIERSEPVRCVCHKKLTAYNPARWTVVVRRLGPTPPKPEDVQGFEWKCFRCGQYLDLVPQPVADSMRDAA